MDYSFKVTTHGRAVLTACMARQAPPTLTRAAFGKGQVSEDVNLADMHELMDYVADGTIGERRHEDDRLYITIQYENVRHPEMPTFYLAEFLIYALDPVTGQETDFLYGTLGDYIQPVPAYKSPHPPTVLQYPLVLILSDELQVEISAPAGLVTYRDMRILIDALGTRQTAVTIPADGWQFDPGGGAYPYFADIPLEELTAKAIPTLTLLPEGASTAGHYGLCPMCETFDGFLRVWSKAVPDKPIPAVLTLTGDASGYFTVGDASPTYTLPPATSDTLGGVKVKEGSGLTVDGSGNLALDAAAGPEIAAAFNDSNTGDGAE